MEDSWVIFISDKMETYEKIIQIPENVEVNTDFRIIKIKGPDGELEKNFDDPRFNEFILFELTEKEIKIKSKINKKKIKSLVGTIAGHTKNMIIGVTIGYKYTMKIVSSHFPLNIAVKENEVHIKNFLGEKGARISKIRGKCEVNATKDMIEIKGINKEDVGQTASNIENICKITGKDRRVFVDGIFIEEKSIDKTKKV